MGGQFLKDEYRHLRQPEYLRFASTPASITWRLLRMRIWRPKTGVTVVPRGHLLASLHQQGWLAAACALDDLVRDWQGVRQRSSVRRDLLELVELRVIEYYPAPRDNSRPSIYRLGEWQRIPDKDGSWHTVEVLYVSRLWDEARDSEPWASDDTGTVASDDPLFPYLGEL
ncbi:MAG: hypothetical protein ACKOWF_09415 [Chloroflexota bacterium]